MRGMAKSRFQFTTRYILLWLTPYVAAACAIFASESTATNTFSRKLYYLNFATWAWIGAQVAIHSRRQIMKARAEKALNPPA
jgi:hypothetical protein